MKAQGFPKSHKLKSRKRIEQLFKEGQSFPSYPLRAVYVLDEEVDTWQVGFSASKKSFKLAVDRNTLKRRCREAFRLKRVEFELPKGLHLLVLYTAREMLDYHSIEQGMEKMLRKLVEKCAEAQGSNQ